MDLYSSQSKSIWQKTVIIIAQLIFIGISYLVLFSKGLDFNLVKNSTREFSFFLLILFNLFTFVRLFFTVFVFIKRKIPLEEVFSIPMAFAVYYVGFPVFALYSNNQSSLTIIMAVVFFLAGCFFNTFSEFQRYLWKRNELHSGHLYTKGLFGLTRHPNYFGDILWVSGYALLTANIYSAIIPILLFFFFYLYNIPLLEKHLELKYSSEFITYKEKVKSLVPFIL